MFSCLKPMPFMIPAAGAGGGCFPWQGRKMWEMTVMTMRTVFLGSPRHCHPYGRTPRKRNMQAWALLALFGSESHPCGQKNPPIFSTAFTGGNTLQFSLQNRVADVPSGLPESRAYALPILRLAASDGRMCGDSRRLPWGYPKITVITVTAVTQRTLTRRRKED